MTEKMAAHVRRLWRHRGTTLPVPRRGPRQQLDLDEILAAGIAIADADGLAAVSTRAIGSRLGRSAMALYPYVGTKEELLALMQDHASAMPELPDDAADLAGGLGAWASALFGLYLAHPWLTERPWSQASQGPNEQDWLERLLRILRDGEVAPGERAVAVTMLYATVRATANTAAAYRRLDARETAAWLLQAAETRRQITDFGRRYPLSSSLEPVTPDWTASPRAALDAAVRLLARSLAEQHGTEPTARQSGM